MDNKNLRPRLGITHRIKPPVYQYLEDKVFKRQLLLDLSPKRSHAIWAGIGKICALFCRVTAHRNGRNIQCLEQVLCRTSRRIEASRCCVCTIKYEEDQKKYSLRLCFIIKDKYKDEDLITMSKLNLFILIVYLSVVKRI
jgi:hypothetical protein